ncbi:hypothetical protein BWQ96_10070 [Gracilariopsis chorda]|uniref:Uncharacterized protein n=1 Tax=Gracilariopsis chorda TaxID=448386 RepID=A0A2V3IDP7_9FLOR|nr:hypothetical protein BWQ96_10070 [Gracilariopsis chorda]|eukprot:PXF40215.1 hypothetical protein BWQ96_10070 [Gracilariopsis chorda]
MTEPIGYRRHEFVPTKRLLEAGVPVIIWSDWDADPILPITSMIRTLQPKSVPDLKIAIKLWTWNPAHSLRQDDDTNSLEKGTYAECICKIVNAGVDSYRTYFPEPGPTHCR